MPACPPPPGRAHLEPQQELAWPILPGTGGPSPCTRDAAQPATARMGSGVLMAVAGQRCLARPCLLPALPCASTAPSCSLWWLLAPTDQHSDPNGKWEGPWGGPGVGVLSTMAMSALHWGAQSRTQQRGRTTSLHLLPTLCLVQPTMQVAAFAPRALCRLQSAQLGVHHDPRWLHSCFPAGPPPAYTHARAGSSSGAGLCSSPC